MPTTDTAPPATLEHDARTSRIIVEAGASLSRVIDGSAVAITGVQFRETPAELLAHDLAALRVAYALGFDVEAADRIRLARRHGASWSAVGAVMGLTRQGAAQWYARQIRRGVQG